ncbi:MAG: hypothetical protein GVY24_01860, partial [Planctomycetes bacterium]|nr:hypothetical protein [Planctomycetota bacterium]
LAITDKGAWRLCFNRDDLQPLPEKALHLSWQPDGDRGLLIKSDRTCLVEKPGAQEILGLRLPPLRQACWLPQRKAWLYLSPSGFGLIPTSPAQDRPAAPAPFKSF